MPIQPIDILRTQEASQLRHMEDQRTQHAQVQISKSFQNMVEQEQSKPKETTKADQSEYRYDAKEQGKNQYYGSGDKQKQKKDDNEKPEVPPKSKGFDILI